MLGVFDSGFGGLTVLRGIREKCPDISIAYLGDSARTPYGNRSREVVTKYTKECCEELFSRGCNLILLACNTASADTLRTLQQDWLPTLSGEKKNIIGVVRPLAEEAVSISKNGRIGVVGTRGTIESGAYVDEIKKINMNANVTQKACPLLVPLVEEGWINKPETNRILRFYLSSIKSSNPDVLVLGCTHYETMRKLFEKKMSSKCKILNTPDVVSRKLMDYMKRHPEYEIKKGGETVFLTTGSLNRFSELGSIFYGEKISNIERIC
ncbi:glutamate racemase [Candidatus Peribacteria bacterium]|nr:glutamate racemase [Candidatus Peribacteria bacterium]